MENCVTLEKLGHTWKNNSDFKKWVTLGKMGYVTFRNVGHTLNKLGHIWKNGSHLDNWATTNISCPQLRKWVTASYISWSLLEK